MNIKSKNITVIGAPSSAGAYGPGQEKAPDALRNAGLITMLKQDLSVIDRNNINGFRWRPDRGNPRAMNIDKVTAVAIELSAQVRNALNQEGKILVLGGDCTVELGCVAAAVNTSKNIGLLYIDLDTDLNTPLSVVDGALDWMGVAHMLNIEGCVHELANLAGRMPMLQPEQVCFFAAGNITTFEQDLIRRHQIKVIPIEEVAKDPANAARNVYREWANQFDHLLIHCDVDVLDFTDLPLAENYRRGIGLPFQQLMTALDEILSMPNWKVLTITEINPDHGDDDGSTLKVFAERLSESLRKAN